MAPTSFSADTTIKQEAPHFARAEPAAALLTPPSPSTKRRRSDESQDSGEKRQRIGARLSESIPADEDADAKFRALVERAKQGAMLQSTPSGNGLPVSQEEGMKSPSLAAESDDAETAGQLNAFTSDPHIWMRIMSLPILESLSVQILSTLQGPWRDTVETVQARDSELGQAYTTLKFLFDQTKEIYSKKDNFLSATELDIQEPEHRATIRIANMATYASAVFGGTIGFYELNDHFIETFTPDGSPMTKEAGDLYVNLKTQMFLADVSQDFQDRPREDIVEDLFPYGLDHLLKSRHPGTELSQSEEEFFDAIGDRREYLLREAVDVASISGLLTKFPWEGFLQSFSSFLTKNYGHLDVPYMERHYLTASVLQPQELSSNASRTSTTPAFRSQELPGRAQEATLREAGPVSTNDSAQNHEGTPPHSKTSPDTNQKFVATSMATPASVSPPPNQSKPTRVLYEQARLAAASRQSAGSAKRPGMPSSRRPWTAEEENALMTGLDQVKGPHWSQILALWGQGGTHGDILKDRNQVQLKDKARNLKLFFLKNGSEVPYYLQNVTGELKTRAPSQAARKEAEARQKLNSDEEKSRINGILTLAKGLHDKHSSSEDATISPPRDETPFDVVEPESQSHFQNAPTTLASDDEHLRQSLMAASDSRAVSTASMI